MRIDGLTPGDIELLDMMWALDTTEELDEFISRQRPGVRNRIEVLHELLIIAGIDDDVEDANDNTLAATMLKNIGVSVK
jgi:hypothetical protein